MRGYRNDPEKTAEAIDPDGWLHTGDIASIDADGYVRIVYRKKEIMINAAGKNMSPANIESTVKVSCPLVGSAVAIGDHRPYVVALLTLDPDAVAAFAAGQHLGDLAPSALAEHPLVQAAVEAGIKEAVLDGRLAGEAGGVELSPWRRRDRVRRRRAGPPGRRPSCAGRPRPGCRGH
jgi:long-subunit acyl-CoA synthetase (AMP-forming)